MASQVNSEVTLYREIDALGGARSEDGEYNAGWSDGHSRALDDVLEMLTKRGFTEASDGAQHYRGWVIEKAFLGWSFTHRDYDYENAGDERFGSAASIAEAHDEIDRLISDAAEAEVIARCAEVVKTRASELRGMANPVGHPLHGGMLDSILDRQANALDGAVADILAIIGGKTPSITYDERVAYEERILALEMDIERLKKGEQPVYADDALIKRAQKVLQADAYTRGPYIAHLHDERALVNIGTAVSAMTTLAREDATPSHHRSEKWLLRKTIGSSGRAVSSPLPTLSWSNGRLDRIAL